MEKIVKVSQFIRFFVVLAALIHVFAGVYIAVSLNSDPSMLVAETKNAPFELSYTVESAEARQLADNDMNAMVWLWLPIQLVYLIIYWLVYRLFSEYQQARIFSVNATKQIKSLGITLMAWPVFSALYPPLLIISLKLFNVIEHGEISLGLGTKSVEMMVLGLMLTVVGWIMGEAQKIKEDQELTI